MLEARAVTLAHGREIAVREASLAVAPGELVALCGPNGAGKSTLLAALAGEMRPRAGAVVLDGAPTASMRARALALRRAVLEQNPVIAAPFTVAALTGLGIGVEIPPEGAASIVERTLAELGLTALADRPVNRLSGGQRHRAHLARVLAQLRAGRALGLGRYLLLDEPTASLDLAHAIAAMQAARRAAADGAGVAVVLHDLDLAASFADRVALMAEGRIVACGPPAAALTASRLAALYRTPFDVFTDAGGRLRVLPAYPPAATARENPSDVHRHEPLPRLPRTG